MNEEYQKALDLLEQIERTAKRAAGLTSKDTPSHAQKIRNLKLLEIVDYLEKLCEKSG